MIVVDRDKLLGTISPTKADCRTPTTASQKTTRVEPVSQTSAVATRSQPPTSLRHFMMQGLLPRVVVLECGFSFAFARVWLCEDL